METYNSEEEQVEAIKKWWKENTISLIAGVAIAGAILTGSWYWKDNNKNQAQQASVIYSEVLFSKNDKVKNTEILKAEYSSTPYASLAALLLAKDHVANNEVDKAIVQLKWVRDNNSDGVYHLAQQRLARLYLSKNDIESAEAVVKGIKAEGFASSYSEIRGDINLEKKLPVQAKENYRLALSSLTPGDQRYATIKMKLDDLTQASKVKIK